MGSQSVSAMNFRHPVEQLGREKQTYPNAGKSTVKIFKSKLIEFIYSPTKQHISESKMAAFLNGLHISDDYQSHSINLAESLFDDNMETAFVNLSPQELEERLKNAQKIVLCDDVKKSLEENSRNEIYQVLADRIEKPCKALILWQPPKPLETLITDFNSYKTNNNDNKEEQEEGDVKDDDKMILE
ncbi:hypothetical protein ACKWTF_008333 [Chironomus riparius]